MIIGITGTDGAGKGVAVDYLVKEKGFIHYSSRALITEGIEARGLPVDREHMRIVANDLRREHGNEFIIKQALLKAKEANIENAVIESVRAMAEVDYLKQNGGLLLAIDADPKLRYERIQSRASESDKVTFEEFMKHEALEMNDPDPSGMQKADVIKSADFTIMNDGSLEELHSKLDKFLEEIAN